MKGRPVPSPMPSKSPAQSCPRHSVPWVPPSRKPIKSCLKSGQVKEPVEPVVLPKLPKTIEEAMKADEVMVAPLIRTTISDDRGEEPCYDGYPASELINKGYEIPHVVGLLWDKRLISKQEAEIVKRIMMLSADHGPCVSGAYGDDSRGLRRHRSVPVGSSRY